MIPDQSILLYQGTWPAPVTYSVFGSVSGELSNILATLTAAGLIVRSSTSSGGVFGVSETINVTLQLQVENGGGFASVDDVISIIRGAVQKETGSFPSGDTIPTVQLPGGQEQPTGQPGVAATSGCADGDIGCYFKTLLSGLQSAIVFIVIGLVAFAFIKSRK